MEKYDAVVIGSGPNGLAAAIEMARHQLKVLVLEMSEEIGGGTRTAELTLPGFKHDFCSAVHPTGILSPYLKELPLEKHGLKWLFPELSVAHPLDDEAAVLLSKDLDATAAGLGKDAKYWKRLFGYLSKNGEEILKDSFKALGVPKNPVSLARFGLNAFLPANAYAKFVLKEKRSRALFAGCAAHSLLPFDFLFSSALGIMFAMSAHMVDWPVAEEGSHSITKAMAAYLKELGGEIQTGIKVEHWKQLPEAKAYLFNTDPYQLAHIAEEKLPKSYTKRLRKYNFGMGSFKLDWALDGPIPWKDPNCLKASTVHIGGTIEEIAYGEKMAWQGKYVDQPYVLLCQQSQIDPSRAPEGKHTGYAYIHVPQGSDKDCTEIIENQVERFAPGFKDIILARHKTFPSDFHQYNPNYFGGAIAGGAADISQLFSRPIARLNPYTTPNPSIYICSASTPPGGGVHGMCGYWAARAALQKQFNIKTKHIWDHSQE